MNEGHKTGSHLSTKYGVWERTTCPNQANHVENPRIRVLNLVSHGNRNQKNLGCPNQTSGLEGSTTNWTPRPTIFQIHQTSPKRNYVTQESVLANQTITNCTLNPEEQTYFHMNPANCHLIFLALFIFFQTVLEAGNVKTTAKSGWPSH